MHSRGFLWCLWKTESPHVARNLNVLAYAKCFGIYRNGKMAYPSSAEFIGSPVQGGKGLVTESPFGTFHHSVSTRIGPSDPSKPDCSQILHDDRAQERGRRKLFLIAGAPHVRRRSLVTRLAELRRNIGGSTTLGDHPSRTESRGLRNRYQGTVRTHASKK